MSAPANRWLVLVAMTGSLSMIMLDQTVVTVALPAMSDDLGLGPTGQQWVVNAYVSPLPPSSPSAASWATGWEV